MIGDVGRRGHGRRDGGGWERGGKRGKGGQARIVRGRWAGGQSLESGDRHGTRQRDLRGARAVRKTQGAGQGGLGRTRHHQRANGRRAGARRALKRRGYGAVTAAAVTPRVSVQGRTLLIHLQTAGVTYGGLNLCGEGVGGFGAWAWGGTGGHT